MLEILPRAYVEGMRAGLERCGVLLDTVALEPVDGFSYTSPRPLIAKAGAALPPKWLFKTLLGLHPKMRARTNRARLAFEQKQWRAAASAFFEEHAPAMRSRLRELQSVRTADLSPSELLDHVLAVRTVCEEELEAHFRESATCMLPVGDYVVHVQGWSGCSLQEALAPLTGSSPDSIDGVTELDRVVAALRLRAPDPDAAAALVQGDPTEVLESLRAAPDPLGGAVGAWLDRVGERIVTGHSLADRRAIELPGNLVEALRARLTGTGELSALRDRARGERSGARLRERVPAEHRSTFDALLAEARSIHPLRDGRSALDFWALGLLRRALLAAGARLERAGLLQAADHAVELDLGELRLLLEEVEGGPLGPPTNGRTAPAPDEVAARVDHREGRTCDGMPDTLGPPSSPPPPVDWLPPAAARVARAIDVYLGGMMKGLERRPSGDPIVRGIPASPGCYRGRARIVRGIEDFAQLATGDVLIARVTTPVYNVVLPLLGAMVTERGGVLSHPAIVSREYGLPCVVGARGALVAIPDGALIEVDGDAGEVRLS